MKRAVPLLVLSVVEGLLAAAFVSADEPFIYHAKLSPVKPLKADWKAEKAAFEATFKELDSLLQDDEPNYTADMDEVKRLSERYRKQAETDEKDEIEIVESMSKLAPLVGATKEQVIERIHRLRAAKMHQLYGYMAPQALNESKSDWKPNPDDRATVLRFRVTSSHGYWCAAWFKADEEITALIMEMNPPAGLQIQKHHYWGRCLPQPDGTYKAAD